MDHEAETAPGLESGLLLCPGFGAGATGPNLLDIDPDWSIDGHGQGDKQSAM